jgi:hypothetical protein
MDELESKFGIGWGPDALFVNDGGTHAMRECLPTIGYAAPKVEALA